MIRGMIAEQLYRAQQILKNHPIIGTDYSIRPEIVNNMKPTILCIMDGWGVGPNTKYNAVAQANTPIFDRLIKKWPNSLMQASGEYVGLPMAKWVTQRLVI